METVRFHITQTGFFVFFSSGQNISHLVGPVNNLMPMKNCPGSMVEGRFN